MSATDFFADLKRFGGKRAMARDEHRDLVRDFILRQKQLAATGFLFLVMSLVNHIAGYFFIVLAIIIFITATRECRRMRACGRYWQTRRSIEVIGI